MKKFFSLVLALVMALSLTTVAWGAANEAKFGDVEYPTLEEAVAAANTAGSGTVTMLTDATVESTLVVNGITLDGNGKTLTAAAALGGMTEDDTETDAMATIRSDAGCTIKNLTVEGGWKGILIQGTATQDTLLENVTVVKSARALNYNASTSASEAYKLTVKNSTLGGWVSTGTVGAATFENCTFVANASERGNGLNTYNPATLTNCTFVAGTVITDEDLADGEKVTINGGTYACTFDGAGAGTFSVVAGTFTDDVIPYLATGSVYKDGVVVKQTSTPTTGTTSTGSVTSGTVTPTKPTLYKLAAVGGSMMKDDENIDEIKLTTTSGRLQNDVPLYVPNIYKVDNFYYIQVAKADADYALYNNGAWIYLFRTPYGSDTAAITAYATSVVMDAKVSPADEDIDCGDCLKGGVLATYYVSGDDVYYAGGNTWAYFNGEFVKYDKDTKVAFKGHVWDATTVTYRATDVKGHQVPVSVECKDCEKTFKVVYKTAFDNTWVNGVDYVNYPFTADYYIVLESATSAPVVTPSTDSDKVTSADTFDAGIAMYVGMSVMAAAGSVVVLKKKD